MFNSTHPAFPFLKPGKTMPTKAATKMAFSRHCFAFIYSVTANLTKHDEASYFYNLFNAQCVGGDHATCSRWSDELLQAVRKKMQAEKILGKDGHVGRPEKESGSDDKHEPYLPPSLSGFASYSNWCNGLYKDLW